MAAEPVKLSYHHGLQPLEKLVQGVRRAGDFFAHGKRELLLPRLEVNGVGLLSFPVPPEQLRAVIGQAARAPYGRGPATILDESVRKVWQLTPQQFTLGGKSWAGSLAGIVQTVATGLGCAEMVVRAELYKLLVYDPGGFFQAHRDTEKTAGMFGTLVVGLPCLHTGGELVIRHAGREAVVDLGGGDPLDVGFVAFFADCEHEVRPITSGHRVCLVYNLVLEAKGAAGPVTAPDYGAETAAAASLLRDAFAEADAPCKLAWLLEHQYTPEGLSFAGLKAADAGRVQVLLAAARAAGCTAHLGIVHLEETGQATPTYESYGRRGHRGYYGSAEPAQAKTADYNVEFVNEQNLYIDQWRNAADQSVAMGRVPLAEGELLPDGALDDEEPDVQRLQEASGNEGVSYERSYHRAALILWPAERSLSVLLQAGVTAVMPFFQAEVDRCLAPGAPPGMRERLAAQAREIFGQWSAMRTGGGYLPPPAAPLRGDMLGLLARLGDAGLVAEFVDRVLGNYYDGSENAALAAGARTLGAAASEPSLLNLVESAFVRSPVAVVDLLAVLARQADAAWLEALRRVAGELFRQWPQWTSLLRDRPVHDYTPRNREAPPPSPVPAELLPRWFALLARLAAPDLRAKTVTAIIGAPEVYRPEGVLLVALQATGDWNPDRTRLWRHAVKTILDRSRRPPAVPTDWVIAAGVDCKCEDCRQLRAFCRAPEQPEYRFRAAQAKRSHLETRISQHALEIDFRTETSGNPHTLVCVKNRLGYRRQCWQYQEDLAALKLLTAVAEERGNPDPALQASALAVLAQS